MNAIRLAIIALSMFIAAIARELYADLKIGAAVVLKHTESGANWLTAKCDAARAKLEARAAARA